MWDPLGTGSWSRLLHHAVNLLKRQALGLRNEEVGVHESARAETAPNEEDGRFEVAFVGADHVGGDDCNDGVPEPVRGGGQTDTTGADRQREDFTDDNPCSRTPGRGEEENEDGDEGNLGVDSRDVVGNSIASSIGVGVVEADGDTDDGNEELADQHAERTPDEERTTSELLNGIEGERGGADVDESEDQGDQESVANSSSGLQEWSGVVENEVDTSPEKYQLVIQICH